MTSLRRAVLDFIFARVVGLGRGALRFAVGNDRGARTERPPSFLRLALVFGVALAATLVVASATGRAGDVQRVIMGDTTFYIPKAWIERSRFKFALEEGPLVDEPSDRDYVAEDMAIIVPGDDWKRLAPIVSSPLPRFSEIVFVPGEGVPYALKQLRMRLGDISIVGAPDEDGFWNWRLHEYLLVGSEKSRPLGLPLIIDCDLREYLNASSGSQTCRGHMYWSEHLLVRYIFELRDFPKSKWQTLDEELQAFVRYLMTPK